MKTQRELFDEIDIFDEDGNPTKEWLDFIKNYKPDKSLPLIDFIKTLMSTLNQFIGFNIDNNIKKLEFHTGGWSGNEQIINAILSNIWLTDVYMKYMKWERGGHYYFDINKYIN